MKREILDQLLLLKMLFIGKKLLLSTQQKQVKCQGSTILIWACFQGQRII